VEIVREGGPGGIEVIRVQGRLDGYWSTQLSKSLSTVIREGARHLRLDFSGVDYISSAVVGVLMRAYKDLQVLEGSLVLVNPTRFVREVLDITKLTPILMGDGAMPVAPAPEPTILMDLGFARFEVSELEAGATLSCTVYGEAMVGASAGYQASDARRLAMPPHRFAIGLGALGETFEDCRSRFGEFLGVPGAVAYQPTDETGTTDYLQAAGKIAPEVMTLNGLYCDGAFARLAHFEATSESGRVNFSQLARGCLDMAGAETAGVVMIAETTGLLGVALKRPPTVDAAKSQTAGGMFDHPGIREWISFHPERMYAGDVALIAGVVSATPAAHLRPMCGAYGHFHAAAFSYRPLRKGKLDLKATVATLFESSQLHGVLHLICDAREISGLGESEFVRGECWVSRIA
jgi:anti-anti-sigma factor